MKYLISVMLLALASTFAVAEDVVPETVTVKCSWGELTMTAIKAGFPQGAHSSDPSGDGKGKGDSDQPRKGLGNVVERGNLQATCEFIASQIQMKYLLLGCLLFLSGCAINSPAAIFCLFSECEQTDAVEEQIDEQIDANLDVSPI